MPLGRWPYEIAHIWRRVDRDMLLMHGWSGDMSTIHAAKARQNSGNITPGTAKMEFQV